MPLYGSARRPGTRGAGGARVTAVLENSGAIGGTNDGNIPTLTATAVARTAAVGTANGAFETVGATNSGDVSAAIMNNTAELNTVVNQLIADDVLLRAGVRELAAKLNALIAHMNA